MPTEQEQIEYCVTLLTPLIADLLKNTDYKYFPYDKLVNIHDLSKKEKIYLKTFYAAIAQIGALYGFDSSRNHTAGEFLYKGEVKTGSQYMYDYIIEKISGVMVPYLESRPQQSVISIKTVSEFLNTQNIPAWNETAKCHRNKVLIQLFRRYGFYFTDERPGHPKLVMYRQVESEPKPAKRGRPFKDREIVLMPHISIEKPVPQPLPKKYSSPINNKKSEKLIKYMELTGQL